MSPLAYFLLVIILISAGCLFLAGNAVPNISSSTKKPYRIIITVYIWMVCGVLSLMVLYFIGTDRSGSPRIQTEHLRHIAHSGYYFSRDKNLAIFGKTFSQGFEKNESLDEGQENLQQLRILRRLMPGNTESATPENISDNPEFIQDGFTHPALEAQESIILRPIWQGEKADNWSVAAKVSSKPLRFENIKDGRTESRCVNLPEERWLNSNDTLFFTLKKENETQFIAIKWVSDSKWSTGLGFFDPFKQVTNAYYYRKGVINGNELTYTSDEILFSEAKLQDGYELDNLLKRGKRDFLKQVGTIDEEWWNIFSGITLVRELRRDTNSRIGVFIANELFQQSDLKIFKNYQGMTSPQLTASNEELPFVISSTTTVIYGLGNNKTLELKLSDEITNDDVWGQVVYVELAHPQLWSLPPSPTADFIITTSNDYIPLNGYFIDIGNTPHAFYAKANFNESLDVISINDGKNINIKKTEDKENEEPSARRFSIGKPASLGDFQQGVLLTLVDNQPAIPYTGIIAIGLLILGAAILTAFVRQHRNNKPRLFLAWTLFWGFFLTILVVRLILAYRVSLLPPLDASPKHLAKSNAVFRTNSF